MTDVLADWWVHTVSVQRWTGTGPSGDVYAAATSVTGFLDDTTKLIRAADGSQVTSSATFFAPLGTAYVPTGSIVTLPAEFGSRTAVVLAVSVHDAGGQPTPDHIELALG